LHLRKIDLADEVYILNVGGYIGESTARELAYARDHGKRIRFLEQEPHTLTPEQIAKAREIISRMPAVPSEIVPIQGDDHKPPTGARP